MGEQPAAEPKLEPCPFCRNRIMVIPKGYYFAKCLVCDYQSKTYDTEAKAIAAHNRIVRAGDLPSIDELTHAIAEAAAFDERMPPVQSRWFVAFIKRWRREREEGGHEGD